MSSPETPATWTLIAGKTGAGKSTVARELLRRTSAAYFSIDEWMETLFWADCPEKNDYPWALERVRRCEEQMRNVAAQLANSHVSAVLDLGFTQREQRLRWMNCARQAGACVTLEVLDSPAEVRWQRVCERNQRVSETYTFAVTREMFDLMEALWEPVSEEERGLVDHTCATAMAMRKED